MPDPTDEEQDDRLDDLEEREDARGYQSEPDGSVSSEHDRQQDARLDELDMITLSPGEAAANPAAQGPSAAQRLRIFVPDVATLLSMGAPASAGQARADECREPTRAGFDVITDGDIFLSAQKGATSRSDPRLVAQAKHDVIIQSETKDVWVGGQQSAIVAAGQGAAVLTGGGGVLIAGGSPLAWSDNVPTGDAPLPAAPAWGDGWGDPAGKINQGWAVLDALVGAVMTGRALISGVLDLPQGVAGAAGWVTGMIGGAVGTGFSANGARGADEIGGTVIHGTSGLILGSSSTAALYSLAGTTIASPVGVSLASTNAIGVLGLVEVDIAGSEVKVSAGQKGATISAANKLHLDSGMHTTLGGRDIMIGEDAAKRKWMTNNIILTAKDGVTIVSSESGGAAALDVLEARKGTEVVRVGAKKHVAIASTDKVSLGVKDGGEVKLTCIDSLTDYLSLKKDVLQMESSSRVSSQVKDSSIDVTDGQIALNVGSYSAVLTKSSFETPSGKFDSSGVKLKGQIRLGG